MRPYFTYKMSVIDGHDTVWLTNDPDDARARPPNPACREQEGGAPRLLLCALTLVPSTLSPFPAWNEVPPTAYDAQYA